VTMRPATNTGTFTAIGQAAMCQSRGFTVDKPRTIQSYMDPVVEPAYAAAADDSRHVAASRSAGKREGQRSICRTSSRLIPAPADHDLNLTSFQTG
jgi:hypothetical protein